MKNSFFNNYTIMFFLLVTTLISLLATSILLFIICKHAKLKSLVTSLALMQSREEDAVTKHEHLSMIHDIDCTSKIQWYIICM